MNLFKLAWKNVVSRPLNTLLSVTLFALGAGLVSLLLLLNHQMQKNFEKNLAGINLVVGAKGSPMQIILSSIYHIDFPTGNISLKQARFVSRNRMVKQTIPMALGDSYKGYRIVGTEKAYLDLYSAELSEGTLWKNSFDAVVGAEVARKQGLKLNDIFHSAHGMAEEGFEHDDHDFKVVGILKPSGLVTDNLIFCDIPTVWMAHEEHEDHEGASESEHNHDDHDHAHDHSHVHGYPPSLNVLKDGPEDKEITALLVFFKNKMGNVMMPRQINENTDMQAASPAFETTRLYSMMGMGEQVLRRLALAIIFVSGLSVFIALYNSMKERRYELALMRSLGATPGNLFSLLLSEGLIITILGLGLGLILGHVSMEILARYMQDNYRYAFTGWQWLDKEFILILVGLVIGFFASVIPAIQAFRTSIASTLSKD